MDIRLVEIVLPIDQCQSVRELLKDFRTIGLWQESLDDTHRLTRVLVTSSNVEQVVDTVQAKFMDVGDFRVLVLRVEATVPTPDDDPPDESRKNVPQRVSRHELYSAISHSADLSPTFLALVALSTVVAGIGLMRDSVAIIIGAMVIAPLLGPNVALALSTTLGDFELARKALKTNVIGVAAALILSCVIGLIFTADLDVPEIAARTHVSLSDPVLALASGCAGVLAYTTGAPTSLIGVMVAVALLPPLTVVGLMLASGNYTEAAGAALLVLVNVICVNLAGVVTFLAQGIRPRSWWEADRAKHASRLAIVIWTLLLATLIAIVSSVEHSRPTHTPRSEQTRSAE